MPVLKNHPSALPEFQEAKAEIEEIVAGDLDRLEAGDAPATTEKTTIRVQEISRSKGDGRSPRPGRRGKGKQG